MKHLTRVIASILLSGTLLFSQSIVYANLDDTIVSGSGSSGGGSAVDWAHTAHYAYRITFVYNKEGPIQTGSKINDNGNRPLKTGITYSEGFPVNDETVFFNALQNIEGMQHAVSQFSQRNNPLVYAQDRDGDGKLEDLGTSLTLDKLVNRLKTGNSLTGGYFFANLGSSLASQIGKPDDGGAQNSNISAYMNTLLVADSNGELVKNVWDAFWDSTGNRSTSTEDNLYEAAVFVHGRLDQSLRDTMKDQSLTLALRSCKKPLTMPHHYLTSFHPHPMRK